MTSRTSWSATWPWVSDNDKNQDLSNYINLTKDFPSEAKGKCITVYNGESLKNSVISTIDRIVFGSFWL